MEAEVLSRLQEIVADRQSRKRSQNGWQMVAWGILLCVAFFLHRLLWKSPASLAVPIAAGAVADAARILLSKKPGSETNRRERQCEWIWPAVSILALSILILQCTWFANSLSAVSSLSIILLLYAGGTYSTGIAMESAIVRVFALPTIALSLLPAVLGSAYILTAAFALLAGLAGGGSALILRGQRPNMPQKSRTERILKK
jgi:hypothetical protein